jgi:Ser-tRNA(Ala) deacylase AlaX
VTAVEGDRVALDRTAFYPTGGGQPHDTGLLAGQAVTDVRKEGDRHTVAGGSFAVGDAVRGEVDWTRRHALMRTHTALHVLCGVIWNEWKVPVTGGNMEPLAARVDFEFDPLPEGFGTRIEELVNSELAADRPIEVSFLPRSVALQDDDLIRTKVDPTTGSAEFHQRPCNGTGGNEPPREAGSVVVGGRCSAAPGRRWGPLIGPGAMRVLLGVGWSRGGEPGTAMRRASAREAAPGPSHAGVSPS